MATIKEQIEMIRAEIDKTQKNKATNAHIGKLKAKIAQLKLKEEKAAAHSKASGGVCARDLKSESPETLRSHSLDFPPLESPPSFPR